MRPSARPLPDDIIKWTRRASALRWLDAAIAWVLVWLGTALVVPDTGLVAQAMVAAILVFGASRVPPLRHRWRPLSAPVALAMSQHLRPGDRAWHVHSAGADLVLVTGRRGLRAVIARPAQGAAEGIPVRRTRVLLIPAE